MWSYKSSPVHKRDIQIDVFARAKSGEYSLIGEVKNREKEKFSQKEAEEFREKALILTELEKVEKSVLFVFSKSGFTKDALQYLEAHAMAWTEEEAWIKEETKNLQI
ncbi:MAG: hypothetical protein R2941_07965 [Desulfobacterales bacterium]